MGENARLLTAGKYCDRDILITSPKVETAKFIKVASDYQCVRAVTTIDITNIEGWEQITADDIYLVIKSVKSTASGTFSSGASCYPIMEYSNGKISLNRNALSGSLVVTFVLDIYILML